LTSGYIVVNYFQTQLQVATMTIENTINSLLGLIIVLVGVIIISGEKGLVMV